ncbi:MAG: DUF1835 domain-containing protein [Bacteroidales bacterium]|nr:DUF1835 domain-containing protein [Bacteroidales bacterium]
MKEKVLHIAEGYYSHSVIAHSGITDKIVEFPLYLSVGHIPKDFSDRELCFSMMSLYNLYESDIILEDFQTLKRLVTQDYSSYDKVVVWHGGGAHELLLLYMMAVIVDDNLYHIDIRDCAEFMKKMGHVKNPDMGDVMPSDISTFNIVSNLKKVSPKEKDEYSKMWYEWTNSKTPYRFSTIVSDCIKEYPCDFMDETIFKVIEGEMGMTRIIGNVMGDFLLKNMRIPDAVIHSRIKDLVQIGELKRSVLLSDNRVNINR